MKEVRYVIIGLGTLLLGACLSSVSSNTDGISSVSGEALLHGTSCENPAVIKFKNFESKDELTLAEKTDQIISYTLKIPKRVPEIGCVDPEVEVYELHEPVYGKKNRKNLEKTEDVVHVKYESTVFAPIDEANVYLPFDVNLPYGLVDERDKFPERTTPMRAKVHEIMARRGLERSRNCDEVWNYLFLLTENGSSEAAYWLWKFLDGHSLHFAKFDGFFVHMGDVDLIKAKDAVGIGEARRIDRYARDENKADQALRDMLMVYALPVGSHSQPVRSMVLKNYKMPLAESVGCDVSKPSYVCRSKILFTGAIKDFSYFWQRYDGARDYFNQGAVCTRRY